MDTAIIITGIIGLGAGVTLGAMFRNQRAEGFRRQLFTVLYEVDRRSKTIEAQAEEIDALQSDNLRLRGQAAELATLAHTADAEAHGAIESGKITERHMSIAESMLAGEIDAHHVTKRRLSAAKGQITKLRKARGG